MLVCVAVLKVGRLYKTVISSSIYLQNLFPCEYSPNKSYYHNIFRTLYFRFSTYFENFSFIRKDK